MIILDRRANRQAEPVLTTSDRKGGQLPQQAAKASTDHPRSEPQDGQAEESQWVGDKVSDKGQRSWVPALVQELIEGDLEILLDRVENGPDGQERDRPSRGCRRDGRAFHIHGERS